MGNQLVVYIQRVCDMIAASRKLIGELARCR